MEKQYNFMDDIRKLKEAEDKKLWFEKVEDWFNYKLYAKLLNLYWEIKYAFQRALRGYDETDVFNLDQNLADRMVKILTEYRNCCDSYPSTMEKDEWIKIINQIIDGFSFFTSESDGTWGYAYNLMKKDNIDYNEAVILAKNVAEEKKNKIQLLINHFEHFWL